MLWFDLPILISLSVGISSLLLKMLNHLGNFVALAQISPDSSAILHVSDFLPTNSSFELNRTNFMYKVTHKYKWVTLLYSREFTLSVWRHGLRFWLLWSDGSIDLIGHNRPLVTSCLEGKCNCHTVPKEVTSSAVNLQLFSWRIFNLLIWWSRRARSFRAPPTKSFQERLSSSSSGRKDNTGTRGKNKQQQK